MCVCNNKPVKDVISYKNKLSAKYVFPYYRPQISEYFRFCQLFNDFRLKYTIFIRKLYSMCKAYSIRYYTFWLNKKNVCAAKLRFHFV